MFLKEGLFYWADSNWATEEDIESYSGTWVCAEKIQWLVADECIGSDEVYRAKFKSDK